MHAYLPIIFQAQIQSLHYTFQVHPTPYAIQTIRRIVVTLAIAIGFILAQERSLDVYNVQLGCSITDYVTRVYRQKMVGVTVSCMYEKMFPKLYNWVCVVGVI